MYFCQQHQGVASFKSAISYGRAPPQMLPPSHIINPQAAFKRGVLQCKFDRKAVIDKAFRSEAFTFDLAQDNFYLLVAWGTMDATGRPNHHKMRTMTSKPIDFGYPPTVNEIMSSKNGVYYEAPANSATDTTGYSYADRPQSIMGQSMYAPGPGYVNYESAADPMMTQHEQRLEYYKDTPLFEAIKGG
jgi:hypothetical protein